MSTGDEVTEVSGGFPVTPLAKSSVRIVADMAAKHGLTLADIRGPGRERKLVMARCEAIRAVRAARPHLSYPQIGKVFHRDHTTVMYHAAARGKHCRCAVRAQKNCVVTLSADGETVQP